MISYRLAGIIVSLLVGLLVSQCASPQVETDLVTYRDAARHFSFEYPREWKIDAEGGISTHYKHVLVALNNLGKERFFLREQQTSSTTWELNGNVIAGLLPPGSAYVEVAWWEGPAIIGIREYKDMESRDLSGLLTNLKEDVNGGRTINISKWGKSWEVTAYLRPPVKDEVRRAMDRVLSSFRFDAIPAGDTEWAVLQASRHLPETANPNMFNIRGSRGNQSVDTRRVADDVIVTFTHDDGQPNHKPIRKWVYHVDSQGGVNAVDPENVEQLVEKIENTPR